MSQSIDRLIGEFDSFSAFIAEAAGIGAEAGADQLHEALKATRRYRDNTGATRAGSLAYVAGRQDQEADDYAARGAELNPGTSVIQEVSPEDPTAITIPITAFQTYDDPLEARVGFVGEALDTAAGDAARAIFDTLAEAFA